MVMGKSYYEKVASDSTPTAVLVQTGDIAFEDLEAAIADIEGFDSIVDDASKQKDDFDTFSSVSGSVVFIYLVLATIMAVVVLLNLNIMFIDEKKRELIVLMINGFSTKDAKAYIYRDSIVLTVIGILLGIVLGSFMGGITVAALEPDLAYYHKGFNEIAALIGAVGAGTFAVAVLLYALRMIPRFNLTDINRF
jgi:ABC-type antimicrobial peptide transport system permease subunit